MKQWRGALVGVTVLAVMGLLSPVRADDKAVRQGFEAIYSQYIQAFQQKDSTAILRFSERYLAPNWTEGAHTRKQWRTMLAQRPWTPSTQSKGKVDRVTIDGSRAVVTFSEEHLIVMPDPSGAAHRVTNRSTTRDSWLKAADGWKCTRSEIQSTKSELDGQPIDTSSFQVPGQ
jgi:hypothetical protein